MANKTRTAEKPLKIGEVTLMVLSETESVRLPTKQGFIYSAYKGPLAVVVVSPSGKRAYSPDGQAIDIERLTREVPDLAKLLEAY